MPDKSVGDFNFIPTAVASSGLDVSFTSSDSLVAEVQSDGRTIKVRAAGTATITANQAGDSAYNAAPAVTQTLTVGYFNLQANSLPGIRLWLDANNIDGDDHRGQHYRRSSHHPMDRPVRKQQPRRTGNCSKSSDL